MARPTEIIYEIEGAKLGEKSTTSVKLENTVTLSQTTTFAAAYATAINNLIGGVIRRATAFYLANITGLTANSIIASSDVEEIAAFQFRTSAGRTVDFNLPCMDESYVEAGSHELDQADSEVAAIITMFEDGIAVTGGTIQPCDIGEESIVSTVYARERFRSSGSRR